MKRANATSRAQHRSPCPRALLNFVPLSGPLVDHTMSLEIDRNRLKVHHRGGAVEWLCRVPQTDSGCGPLGVQGGGGHTCRKFSLLGVQIESWDLRET